MFILVGLTGWFDDHQHGKSIMFVTKFGILNRITLLTIYVVTA